MPQSVDEHSVHYYYRGLLSKTGDRVAVRGREDGECGAACS